MNHVYIVCEAVAYAHRHNAACGTVFNAAANKDVDMMILYDVGEYAGYIIFVKNDKPCGMTMMAASAYVYATILLSERQCVQAPSSISVYRLYI